MASGSPINDSKFQMTTKERVREFLETIHFAPLMTVFVGSAILQNMCQDQIRNNGGGGKETVHLLTFAANAMGNVLVGLLPGRLSIWKCNWKKASVPAVFDMISQVFLQFGVVLAGAQIYSMLYNSCIVWTVILSYMFLKARFSAWQMMSILLVIIGVGMKSFINSVDGSDSLILGTILILVGCFMHSLTNIINEHYIRKYDFPPTKLSGIIGLYSIMGYAVFFIGWNSWRIQEQILDEIEDAGSEVGTVSFWYALFVLCNFLHAACFFLLLGRIGNVGTAVVKGLKTGSYIFISHFMYCPELDKYCLFPLDRWQRTVTLISALLSIAGVIAYGFSTKAYKARCAAREAASKASSDDLVVEEGKPEVK